MAEVYFCNNSFGIRHLFSSPALRTKSFITHLLTPQEVNIKDKEGNSLLHFAVASNDKSIIELLLNAGAGVNDIRMDGYTPLHMAVESGDQEIIKILLDHGARLDIQDLFGKTALHLAACLNYQDERIMLRIAESILNRAIDIKVCCLYYTVLNLII